VQCVFQLEADVVGLDVKYVCKGWGLDGQIDRDMVHTTVKRGRCCSCRPSSVVSCALATINRLRTLFPQIMAKDENDTGARASPLGLHLRGHL
jgi:hypothetical protein